MLELLAEIFAYPERDCVFTAQLEAEHLGEKDFLARVRDFAPGNEKRRMSDAKREKWRDVQAFRICTNRNAIVITRNPAHMRALPTEKFAGEFAFKTETSRQGMPSTAVADEQRNDNPKERECQDYE
ncbi:MAG: hypothetical protein ACRD4H_11050 [Candidatus Acidiferrales bacterium]